MLFAFVSFVCVCFFFVAGWKTKFEFGTIDFWRIYLWCLMYNVRQWGVWNMMCIGFHSIMHFLVFRIYSHKFHLYEFTFCIVIFSFVKPINVVLNIFRHHTVGHVPLMLQHHWNETEKCLWHCVKSIFLTISNFLMIPQIKANSRIIDWLQLAQQQQKMYENWEENVNGFDLKTKNHIIKSEYAVAEHPRCAIINE